MFTPNCDDVVLGSQRSQGLAEKRDKNLIVKLSVKNVNRKKYVDHKIQRLQIFF